VHQSYKENSLNPLRFNLPTGLAETSFSHVNARPTTFQSEGPRRINDMDTVKLLRLPHGVHVIGRHRDWLTEK
jgi:hypothetical protein